MFLQTNDYGAPSLQQLDYVVSYIGRQIGRTGTILAAYLIKKGNVLNAYQTINRLRNIRGESIQSKEQEDIVFS